MGPLAAAEERSFDQRGFVLIDAQFSVAELDAAEDTWDRLMGGSVLDPTLDEGYLAVIGHPFLEAVAKQLLRSERVWVNEDGVNSREPEPVGSSSLTAASAEGAGTAQWPWRRGLHIDWQVSEQNFDATPRHDLLAVWIWVNDVPEKRGAMRLLPGSHRAIGRHWERVLSPAQLRCLPRHHSLFAVSNPDHLIAGGDGVARPAKYKKSFPEHIADDPNAKPFGLQRPVAAAAKRGQALVFTQSMLHAASRNFDVVPRKGFICSWIAADVLMSRSLGRRFVGTVQRSAQLHRSMRQLRPGREHIFPTGDEVHEFPRGDTVTLAATQEDELWPGTFMPGQAAPKPSQVGPKL